MDQIKLRLANENLPFGLPVLLVLGVSSSEIQAEPMCERRVSTAAPAGVLCDHTYAPSQKKKPLADHHTNVTASQRRLLDAQALRWTRL